MDEYEQIEETREYEVAEMEREMDNDPRYHLWSAIEYMDRANDILWNKGMNEPRDYLLVAIGRAKTALRILEDESWMVIY